MDTSPELVIPLSDLIALMWFLFCWCGYNVFARAIADRMPNLVSIMNRHRRQWMQQVAQRGDRIIDNAILSYLSQAPALMASTTIFILGGLVATWTAGDRMSKVIAELPFASVPSVHIWEVRVLLLIVVFTYAFFKFSWGIRLYNYSAVMVGSLMPKADLSAESGHDFIDMAFSLVASASESVNSGYRAYYFGIAAAAWLLQPWLFMLLTTLVVWIVYLREFLSPTVRMMTRGAQTSG